MDIVICDRCYGNGKGLIEAVEMIPELQLSISKRRIAPVGLCADHLEELFPVEEESTRPAIQKRVMNSSRVPRSSNTRLRNLPAIPHTHEYVDSDEGDKIHGLKKNGFLRRAKKAGLLAVAVKDTAGNAYLWKRSDAEALRDKPFPPVGRPRKRADTALYVGDHLGFTGKKKRGRPSKVAVEEDVDLRQNPNFMTTQEVADHCNVTTKAVNFWVNNARSLTPAMRQKREGVGGQTLLLFRRAEVEAFQREREKKGQ